MTMKTKKIALASILCVLGAFCGPKPAHADPLAVTIGPLTLQMPFQDVKAVSLYDFNAGKPLVGGETVIGDIWYFELQAGAVTSLQGRGAPFFSADFSPTHPLLAKILPENVNIGVFGGYDFNQGSPIYGLKASLGLW
jgi:hypothetical protein